MDFTSKGIAWIEKVGAKLENLCSEVDARSQEQLDYVESQLQIAGANLKQFCSEFIQEIFPASLSDAKEDETSNLSSEENIKKQLLASELSNITLEEDNKKELSHSNSSSIVFLAETAEGVHIDFSLQPQADMVMKMSVEDNSEKALSSGESVDHHVNEPGVDSVPEVEFDGNCVLVYKDDLSSCSEFYGAHISHKKNMTKLEVKPGNQRNKDTTIYEGLSVESEQSITESKPKSSPNEKLELSEEGFCDSDWEIISLQKIL